jgi:hypothetical protein
MEENVEVAPVWPQALGTCTGDSAWAHSILRQCESPHPRAAQAEPGSWEPSVQAQGQSTGKATP